MATGKRGGCWGAAGELLEPLVWATWAGLGHQRLRRGFDIGGLAHFAAVAVAAAVISLLVCSNTSSLQSRTFVLSRHGTLSAMIDPAVRLRRAIHVGDGLLAKRILTSHPSLLHNPDSSLPGLSNSNLHLAASLGHKDICEALLKAGHEDPCPALNENHQTALMLAASAGHPEVVHLLCEYDRSCILRQDIRGRDAIMDASMGGHDTALQILLTYVPGGPRDAVQRADLEGNTALHFASSNGNLMGLRTLLAAGADVERRNIWNWTPAAYSATVQAEVYLKGLVTEVDRRQQLRKEIEATKSKKGGAMRMVTAVGDDDR
ncbi:spherulin-1B precursor [Metarhizium rileyi]|uniref:Spherulin-1B n=1 Tax=Metarhizium rileyi (strain RCEF 4871) TaxID=1649241 RepID=A0A166ZFK3_METRR|nr:spherulin-1B precursor [Metarhizium rileyi RCEF 4871]